MSLRALSKIESRQRNLLALGLFGVLLAAMLVYVVVPEAKRYKASTASRTAMIGAATTGSDLVQQIDARMQSIAELSRRLHGDSANLPLREMESFVIGRLQKISWHHDIELIGVQPGAGEQVQQFREILFRVELEGKYDAVHKWLWEVRNQLGFVVIKEFSLARGDANPTDPRLRATLTMASYRMVST